MKKIYTLRLIRGGLFFQINNVIDFLDIAERNDFCFNIEWENCLYEDPSKSGPVWNYFFEDIFDIDHATRHPIYPYRRFRKDHLTAPRVKDGRMEPLLLPRDKHLANDYIEKYLRLKPHIQRIINQFKDKHFKDKHFRRPIVGLHLRGPGRLHGGVPALLKKLETKEGVPYQVYFRHVDNYLEQEPNARIFLCSDSNTVIRECMKKYDDKIITYDASRSEFGEMHVSGLTDKGKTCSRYKLGEDVLVEAHLLAETDYFVHGNSNVSNFVLCKKPALRNRYVFENVKVNWSFVYLKRDIGKAVRSTRKLFSKGR